MAEQRSKYRAESMLPALRLFVAARREALDSGFTDNGGAIHSVERIVDILSSRLCYPHISHINTLKSRQDTECSIGAQSARMNGEAVFLEHVMPQRAFARSICALVESGVMDEEIIAFIRERYRLVLLSADETRALNALNRSRLSDDRIADAGIEIAVRRASTS